MAAEDPISVEVLENTREQVTRLREQLGSLGSAASLVGTTKDNLLLANQEMAALGERVTSLADSLAKLAEELAKLKPAALSNEHSQIINTASRIKTSVENLDLEGIKSQVAALRSSSEAANQEIKTELAERARELASNHRTTHGHLERALPELSLRIKKLTTIGIVTLVFVFAAAIASIVSLLR